MFPQGKSCFGEGTWAMAAFWQVSGAAGQYSIVSSEQKHNGIIIGCTTMGKTTELASSPLTQQELSFYTKTG